MQFPHRQVMFRAGEVLVKGLQTAACLLRGQDTEAQEALTDAQPGLDGDAQLLMELALDDELVNDGLHLIGARLIEVHVLADVY